MCIFTRAVICLLVDDILIYCILQYGMELLPDYWMEINQAQVW